MAIRPFFPGLLAHMVSTHCFVIRPLFLFPNGPYSFKEYWNKKVGRGSPEKAAMDGHPCTSSCLNWTLILSGTFCQSAVVGSLPVAFIGLQWFQYPTHPPLLKHHHVFILVSLVFSNCLSSLISAVWLEFSKLALKLHPLIKSVFYKSGFYYLTVPNFLSSFLFSIFYTEELISISFHVTSETPN